MYKGKMFIWFLILGICSLIYFGGDIKNGVTNFWNENFKKTELDATIKFNEKDDIQLISVFEENSVYEIDDVRLHLNMADVLASNENIDIFFSKHSTNTIEKYEKLSQKLYSPIVMFVEDSLVLSSENSGFTIIQKSQSSSSKKSYTKDFKLIIDGLLENKKWSDLGVNSLDGKIKVLIPSENSNYYNDVVKFFLLSLYDTPTTKENVNERLSYVYYVIEKCEKVENVNNLINEGYLEKNEILIIPEYLTIQTNKMYFNFTPIYPIKTNIISYDIFIKENLTKNDLSVKDYFEKILISNYDFFENIGFRVKDKIYKFSDITGNYNNMLENITIVQDSEFIFENFNTKDFQVEPYVEIKEESSTQQTVNFSTTIQPTPTTQPIIPIGRTNILYINRATGRDILNKVVVEKDYVVGIQEKTLDDYQNNNLENQITENITTESELEDGDIAVIVLLIIFVIVLLIVVGAFVYENYWYWF